MEGGNTNEQVGKVGELQFDAEKHLVQAARPLVLRWEALGYQWSQSQLSPVAVSQPFPLFSPEAIDEMRKEIFQDEIWEKHQYASKLSSCQLRGYAKDLAPFTYAAWNDFDTVHKISEIAEVYLTPVMDYEIAHINISKHTAGQAEKAEAAHAENKNNHQQGHETEDAERPIVRWHKDAYPFVCVLMMSDCEGMVGGETVLKTEDGSIVKVKAPQKGWAYILQGRHIEHQAAAAFGSKERITAVTSFRPHWYDDEDTSVLTSVRPVSDLRELYRQFVTYRLGIVKEHIAKVLESLEQGALHFEDEFGKWEGKALADFDDALPWFVGDLEDIGDVLKGTIDQLKTHDEIDLADGSAESEKPAEAKEAEEPHEVVDLAWTVGEEDCF